MYLYHRHSTFMHVIRTIFRDDHFIILSSSYYLRDMPMFVNYLLLVQRNFIYIRVNIYGLTDEFCKDK